MMQPIVAPLAKTVASTTVADNSEMSASAADLRDRFLDRVAMAAVLETETHSGPNEDPDELPRNIGRYRILDRLGVGGMGVVYAAYDETLDRKVAIKVLHDHVWDRSGRRRERLLREAQAMAKLTHPHLVTVHEIGTTYNQLFVAMEFVPGPTLEEWLRLTSRSWREIAAVFGQIARGLAALHDAGLMHRDVKPSNVIVGDDGRVRVLDLGLVGVDAELQSTDEGPPTEWSSSLSRVNEVLTRTGDRLGTPAYMSPEQFRRERLTTASDVFSLCVTLYEALYEVHPFLGQSLDELQENVLQGRVAPPRGTYNVPTWLHALAMRGLAISPEDRPASMHEIATALDRDPRLTRRRWLGTSTLVAFAGFVGIMWTKPESTQAPRCDRSADVIAGVWNPEKAQAIEAAMRRSELPYAMPLATRVIDTLDAYANDWSTAHRQACLDHHDGTNSEDLLDARMTCLDRHRRALSATVSLIANADASVVEHAGDMVAKLPRIEVCNDLAALKFAPSPPADPSVAARLEELETELVNGVALANAGQLAEATALISSVAAEAAKLDRPNLQARALLSAARASAELPGEPVAGPIDEALFVALEHGMDSLAAEAMIRRIYIHGLVSEGSANALADVPIANALLTKAGDLPELQGLLLNNIGAIHLAAGERASARPAFEESLQIKQGLFGRNHPELVPTMMNIAISSDDAAEREAMQARVIAIHERHLGPDHPRTLGAHLFAALHREDPAAASANFTQLCPHLADVGASELASACHYEWARREYALGHDAIAHAAFVAARPALVDPDQRVLVDAYVRATADSGTTSDQPGPEADALLELIERSAADMNPDWWGHMQQAERRLVLAQLSLNAGASKRARDQLALALDELERIADVATPHEHARLLALVQAALAHVLSDRGDAERASTLAAAANAFFTRWPDSYHGRIAELKAPSFDRHR